MAVGGVPTEAAPSQMLQQKNLKVVVRTSANGFETWGISLEVPRETTVAEFRQMLQSPPNSLRLKPKQRVLKRLRKSGTLINLEDREPVAADLVLLDFTPEDAVVGNEPKQEKPAAAHTLDKGERMVNDPQLAEKLARAMHEYVHQLIKQHDELGPLERRARSFARCISFGHMMIAYGGPATSGLIRRRGSKQHPIRVWVLAASPEIEGFLAEEGVFQEVNMIDRGWFEVLLCGHRMQPLVVETLNSEKGQNVQVQAVSYERLLAERPPKPELVALHMPQEDVPEEVLSLASGAPVIITSRWALSQEQLTALGGGKPDKVLDRTRGAVFAMVLLMLANRDAALADNKWFTLVEDAGTLMGLNGVFEPQWPEKHEEVEGEQKPKIPTIFWGIIDLKYDSSLPYFERVKILETGNGRTSRFSGAGADILRAYQEGYCLEDGAATAKHAVISANKKLTHDILGMKGYTHLLPRQVCFPRAYEPNLAERIKQGLEVSEEDAVVLKLCNRTRAAGVLPVHVWELDEVLKQILVLPEDTEGWLQRSEQSGPLAFLQVKYGSYEEHVRHWWSNECPFFVAERLCRSVPTPFNGSEYDGTLRVAFALKKKERKPDSQAPEHAAGPGAFPPPEELEVDWLGGYWKLPKAPIDSENLRERVISAARTGTAHVDLRCLAEVYAALGTCIPSLFGGADPTVEAFTTGYRNCVEVSSYLIARLAVATRNQARCLCMMEQAKQEAAKLEDGAAKLCAKSFISRALAVSAYQVPCREQLPQARRQLQRSLDAWPFNASSLYLLGMIHLEETTESDPQEAVRLMYRSLLLDPDFKGPYVNLGVAFLRLGCFDEAITVSEAGLERHPQSPQCSYHIGVACYRKSILLESGAPTQALRKLHKELRQRALQCIQEARASEEGQKAQLKVRFEVPWSEQDDAIVKELQKHMDVFVDQRRMKPVELGPQAGWRWYQWRV